MQFGKLFATSLIAAVAVFGMVAPASASLLTDGSFETPDQGVSGYTYYTASVGGWDFNNEGILNAQGFSAWYGNTSPSGFDGNQYAFLQSNGSISQTFTATSTGTYNISWVQAGRPNFGSFAGDQSYNVLLNGVVIGTELTVSGQNFTAESLTANLTNGNPYTLTFQGLATTDETSFLDNVSVVSAVPLPASVSMMMLALAVVGAYGLRRQRI